MGGKCSPKVDIYSFGVGAQKERFLCCWICSFSRGATSLSLHRILHDSYGKCKNAFPAAMLCTKTLCRSAAFLGYVH